MTKLQIRILIVEDDIVDRMACRRSFAQDDHDYEFVLDEAETARDGLHLAKTKNPDCVLLDYHLPDMNGLEFLAELRNDQGEILVPVIMLTGADNASVAVEAIKRGAQDYLVKDSNLQYLELLPAVIQRVLRERLALAEKKQMESLLVQAEAKYRFLVEQIPAIIYTAALDIPGKLLYVSPQLKALGYSPEEWTANEGVQRNRIHPDDRKRAEDAFESARATGKPLRCEYRLLNSAGEVRWFLDETCLVHDESGKALFLQGILLDITEDKKVEEELRLHRQRLEELVANRTAQFDKQSAILKSANANLINEIRTRTQAEDVLRKCVDRMNDFYNNAPCGYHSLDPDGVFVQINDTELKWHGLAREAVVGKMRFTDMLTSESGKIFLASYQQLKESGLTRDLELEILHQDGTKQLVMLSANAIKDAEGRFVMSRTVLFDITNFKRAK